MRVIFYDTNIEERFEAKINNLIQLYDYLKVNKPNLFTSVNTQSLCYTVYDADKEKAYPILPTMLDYDISSYEILVICPKLEGEAIFSSIVSGMLALGASMTAAVSVATVVTVGTIIGLGMLIRALSPQNKLDNNQDPSQLSKLYNGVPNITEQGGSVPVVFGNCLFGGVRIGLRLEQTLQMYPDVIPVSTFAAGMSYPSNWMKFV